MDASGSQVKDVRLQWGEIPSSIGEWNEVAIVNGTARIRQATSAHSNSQSQDNLCPVNFSLCLTKLILVAI